MKVAPSILTAAPQSCAPGRKSDYAAGFTNGSVQGAWGICRGSVSRKWDPFCEALLAVYRGLGRQRLQVWLAELRCQSIRNPQSVIRNVSDAELGLIWHRSAGFVREHKRRPFEANMLALQNLDPAGFWLLISELDFRDRLVER